MGLVSIFPNFTYYYWNGVSILIGYFLDLVIDGWAISMGLVVDDSLPCNTNLIELREWIVGLLVERLLSLLVDSCNDNGTIQWFKCISILSI